MNLRRKIFESILDHQVRWNHPPTRSEVRTLFADLSDDVDLHLEQLEREGLLTLEPDGGQHIVLSPTFVQTPRIRIQNSVKSVAENSDANTTQTIMLDLQNVGIAIEPEMYAMRVHDDDMEDAGIRLDDIVILTNASPTRGKVVAVELNGRLALRRYVLPLGIPHLLAENSVRPDLIPALNLPIHGVFWGLIRTEQCFRSLSGPHTPGNRFPEQETIFDRTASLWRYEPPATPTDQLNNQPTPRLVLPEKRRRASQVSRPKKTGCPKERINRVKPPSGFRAHLENASLGAGSALKQAILHYEESEQKRGKIRLI